MYIITKRGHKALTVLLVKEKIRIAGMWGI